MSISDEAPAHEGESWTELVIDGQLDLHTFQPRDVKDLVPTWIAECVARGILEVRIVHGKGTGQLRRLVHTLLGRDPHVVGFRLAPEDRGGWGATLAELEPSAAPPMSETRPSMVEAPQREAPCI